MSATDLVEQSTPLKERLRERAEHAARVVSQAAKQAKETGNDLIRRYGSLAPLVEAQERQRERMR